MPPTLIFDYFSTLVMGKQAEAMVLTMRFLFTDADLPAIGKEPLRGIEEWRAPLQEQQAERDHGCHLHSHKE